MTVVLLFNYLCCFSQFNAKWRSWYFAIDTGFIRPRVRTQNPSWVGCWGGVALL